MYSEDDVVLVSAVEHFSYCPRQCALIHVESIFDENVFTLRGRQAHERVDQPEARTEAGVRVERALPIWSNRYGLFGKADAVEMHADGRVIPVEYKHGPRRLRIHDDVQLCAQALCLEEMLGVAVQEGAIYSIQTRRRRTVPMDDALRRETLDTIDGVRQLLRQPTPLPPALNDDRCPKCSLLDACLPASVVAGRQRRLLADLYIPPPLEDQGDARSTRPGGEQS